MFGRRLKDALVDEFADEVVTIEALTIDAVFLDHDTLSFDDADFARLKIEAKDVLPWTLADASNVFKLLFCHSGLYNKATAPRITRRCGRVDIFVCDYLDLSRTDLKSVRFIGLWPESDLQLS